MYEACSVVLSAGLRSWDVPVYAKVARRVWLEPRSCKRLPSSRRLDGKATPNILDDRDQGVAVASERHERSFRNSTVTLFVSGYVSN